MVWQVGRSLVIDGESQTVMPVVSGSELFYWVLCKHFVYYRYFYNANDLDSAKSLLLVLLSIKKSKTLS